MKKLLILSLGLMAAVAPLPAQDNQQQPTQTSQGGGSPWEKRGKKHGPPPGANLTPEEQQRLGAAREKAKEDPTVRSLREAKQKLEEQLETAMRAAVLAADPSLASTLDKVKAARDRAKEMRGKFESLTPEQKQQLKAARDAAKNDPAVQAAREKVRNAQGPDAKRAAAREMHDAMKSSMLKTDPTLGPLLEKLGPGMMGHRLGKDPSQRDEGTDGPPPPDTNESMGQPGLE